MNNYIMNILLIFNTTNPLRLPPQGQYYTYQTLQELETVKRELNYFSNKTNFIDLIKNLHQNWKHMLNDQALYNIELYLEEQNKLEMLRYIRNSPELKKLEEEQLDELSNSLLQSNLTHDEIRDLNYKISRLK